MSTTRLRIARMSATAQMKSPSKVAFRPGLSHLVRDSVGAAGAKLDLERRIWCADIQAECSAGVNQDGFPLSSRAPRPARADATAQTRPQSAHAFAR
jgi:hypothetical protein